MGIVIVGGGGFWAECECCGSSKKSVEITGWWAGAVVGIKGSTSSSKVTLYDGRPADAEPDERVFWGNFKYVGGTAAVAKWGISGSLLLQIGQTSSELDSGGVNGWWNIDASASFVGGKVTDVKVVR